MKKLKLIIPRILSVYVIFSLFIFQPQDLFATDGFDGCHITTIGGQNRNYHIPFSIGAGSPTEWISNSVGEGGYNLNTGSKCIKDLGPSCVVYKFGTGSSPSSSDILYSGTYAILVACPIDDYTPLLAILMGGTACFFIRRRLQLLVCTL